MTKSFLSVCAGPLLLALAASAYKSDYGRYTPTDSLDSGTTTSSRDTASASSGYKPDYDSSDESGSEGSMTTYSEDDAVATSSPSSGTSTSGTGTSTSGDDSASGSSTSASGDDSATSSPSSGTSSSGTGTSTSGDDSASGSSTSASGDDSATSSPSSGTSTSGTGTSTSGDDSASGTSTASSGGSEGYGEYVEVAGLLPETCEFNTYMCCWTENDGDGMEDNTDVCRVGQTAEYPGDSEGEVHCHGLVWPVGAALGYIHNLAHFVENFDHRDSRGYFGNIEGAPMCSCLEEMPTVSRADCTTYDAEGEFTACTDNDLRTRYLEEFPMGELGNLVEECDNVEGGSATSSGTSSSGTGTSTPGDDSASGSSTSASGDDSATSSPSSGTSSSRTGTSTSGDDSGGSSFVEVEGLLTAKCEHNTYMCCWTENDGDGMEDNTDVCRVVDYPEVGQTDEYPGDSEGEVHCHGLVWPEGSTEGYIHNLAHFVENFDHRDSRGYFGNIEGAPMCGCLEEMPTVSRADCTTYDAEGEFTACTDNDLRTRYLEEFPMGELYNLVEECDNPNVLDFEYAACAHNTYMCCWTENDGDGMEDNTDVCRVVDYPAMGQTVEYPGESEGEVHCHGLVWPEGSTERYIDNLVHYVKNFDHKDNRGYFGNIEGAPMCGCLETMPTVSRADCTTYVAGTRDEFTACTDNDLRTRYLEVYTNGELGNLVEECDNTDG